jgi:CHAT domain-containing protein
MFEDRLDPAAALRAAQIKLLRRRITQAPFFWGAFEVHGLSPRFFPLGTAP